MMKPENIEKIHESFAQQAAEFEKPGRIFSKICDSDAPCYWLAA